MGQGHPCDARGFRRLVGLVGKRTSLSSVVRVISSLALLALILLLGPSHQAKAYGKDGQADTSDYNINKLHTLNLRVAEPRHERPRHLKFGTASGKVTP